MQSYFKNKWLPYILLLPTFIILVVFLFYPAFETFRLSLYKVHPFGITKKFAGFYNFIKLFGSEDYRQSFFISMVFSIAVVVVGLTLSLLIALLLNQQIKGARIYRSLLIWPYAPYQAPCFAFFSTRPTVISTTFRKFCWDSNLNGSQAVHWPSLS